MLKVDVPQILISSATIFGIGLVWYDFNVKIFHTVRDLLGATLFEKDEEKKIRDILNAYLHDEDDEDDEDEEDEEKTD